MGNSWKFVLKKQWQGEKSKSPQAETIYKIHKISPALRAGCKKNVFPQRKRHKKRSTSKEMLLERWAATYFSTNKCSIISEGGLNFSVRNGKR